MGAGTGVARLGKRTLSPQRPERVNTGHLLADAYGLRDVVPFVGEQLHTVQQLDEAIARLRAAGGNTVVIGAGSLPQVAGVLVARGFAILTRSGFRRGVPGRAFPARDVVVEGGLTKWTDAARTAAQEQAG